MRLIYEFGKRKLEKLYYKRGDELIANRLLVDFTVGTYALMIGNLSAVIIFLAQAKVRFLLFSIATMTLLVCNALWAQRMKKVNQINYAITFLITYVYGLVMFMYCDNSRGSILFGLVYPVLALYILKFFWGNILVALEFVTSIIAERLISRAGHDEETLITYVTIYIMFWAFSNAIEATSSFVEMKILEQKEQLAFYADYDGLTKMFNRRKFYQCVNEMFAIKKTQKNVALIILDVDDFKKINDSYGHSIGDEVLVEIANRIHANIRKTDIACRWGGEEFLVLVKAVGSSVACGIAQKLCNEVGNHPFTTSNGDKLCITISVGLSYAEDFQQEKLSELVSIADNNLYNAKRNGKNQVCDL